MAAAPDWAPHPPAAVYNVRALRRDGPAASHREGPMTRSRSTMWCLMLLAIVAFAGATAWAASAKDEKKPAAGPLEVTYYYLPG